MFPMVPYANRIAGNEFTFEGQRYSFKANNLPERFNVHGTGWQTPWDVVEAGSSEAELQLEYFRPREEPYSYLATQRFRLKPDRLEVTMTITNRSGRPMPFGLGQHPWFPRSPDVSIQFHALQFWLEGPDGVATDSITTPPELDFSEGGTLPQSWRNNGYGHWAGVAEIRYPSREAGLRIEADPLFRHLMFYADPTKPHFCLEPQTNAVCAFNKIGQRPEADLGVIVLKADQTTKGTMWFTPLKKI
jgi:aldose 1-epimerase